MIVEKKSWLGVLLVWRGTALARVWRRVLFVTLIAVVITTIDLQLGVFHADLTTTPFALIAVALGIFLGFRNNTSYDRFWEGRKLWGRMVNTARTLTRQILTLVGPVPGTLEASIMLEERAPEAAELVEFHREMVHRLAAYVHCVRMHLRDQDPLDELRRLLPEHEVEALRHESNRPIAILQTLGDRVRDAWSGGWIHHQHVMALDQSLTDLCDIQGGCERIKNTPIPFSYTALIHRIVALYCIALPFGLVASIQGFTPIVVAIISYAFFGLDAVGDEIEDPFGTDCNDLPLSSLTAMIEVNVRQRLGEEGMPPMPRPVDGVLT